MAFQLPVSLTTVLWWELDNTRDGIINTWKQAVAFETNPFLVKVSVFGFRFYFSYRVEYRREDLFVIHFPFPEKLLCLHPRIEWTGVKKSDEDFMHEKAIVPGMIVKRELDIASNEICDIMTRFYRYSIDTSTLLSICRCPNVTPIYKGGSKTCADNRQSLSLTSVPCKMSEHIITMHNTSSKLNYSLSLNQHGFRNSLSCTTEPPAAAQGVLHDMNKGDHVK